MYAEPSHRSEMISEILFGEGYDIVEKHNKTWLKIALALDGYEGWIEYDGPLQTLETVPVRMANSPGKLVSQSSLFRINPGSPLPFGKTNEVTILDTDYVADVSSCIPAPPDNADGFLEFCRQFLNTPYYWGGRSLRGIDCSGLVQVIYSRFNCLLPRDSGDQFLQGSTVSFDQIRIGDLAFFKNEQDKIVHVGICLGESEIMHASEFVRIDELTESGIFNHSKNRQTHKLAGVKRVLKPF